MYSVGLVIRLITQFTSLRLSLRWARAIPALSLTLLFMTSSSFADFGRPIPKEAYTPGIPSELKEIGVTEHLGNSVSISEFTFRDEDGKSVHLSDYFHKKRPVILTLVYYQCPNLCNFQLNGLVHSLRNLDWTAGDQFEIVSVSIHPKEGPELATGKKAAYLKAYERPKAAAGWHFLTGDESQSKKLASELGFGYRYDEQEKQYAHSAAIFVLTPEGKISRYLYGIEFPNKDLRLALLEASNGMIGTVVDRLLLFCYRYDPQTRKYSVYLTKLMQAGCGSTVVIFGGYLAIFWRRQRRKGA
jgi:protein SCO1/2